MSHFQNIIKMAQALDESLAQKSQSLFSADFRTRGIVKTERAELRLIFEIFKTVFPEFESIAGLPSATAKNLEDQFDEKDLAERIEKFKAAIDKQYADKMARYYGAREWHHRDLMKSELSELRSIVSLCHYYLDS